MSCEVLLGERLIFLKVNTFFFPKKTAELILPLPSELTPVTWTVLSPELDAKSSLRVANQKIRLR